MDNIIVITQEALEAAIAKVVDSRIAQFSGVTTATAAKEIIDTKELIKRLNITGPTVIRMRKRKALPFIQIGTSIRYEWDAVLKALENKKSKA